MSYQLDDHELSPSEIDIYRHDVQKSQLEQHHASLRT